MVTNMGDVVHLTSLMIVHLLLVPFVAGALHLSLRDIEVGGAEARHVAAKSCFYGAALLPLISFLPSQLTIAFGPERILIYEGAAPVVTASASGQFVQSLCFYVVAIVLVAAGARICRTLLAALKSEWLARTGTPLLPDKYGIPRGFGFGLLRVSKVPSLPA